MKGRTLLATPQPVTFAPAAGPIVERDPNYPLALEDDLGKVLAGITWAHPELYENVLSVIQSISSIRKGRRTRTTVKQDSKGARLKRLEESIANLDARQNKAVIETVDGVQRIRGLAGSGKTIILALKAAYLHSQHPDWKIAVTFNTRSLKEQFRRLINNFVIEQSGDEPDWSKIYVVNAWGAPGDNSRTGLYFQFTQAQGIDYVDFGAAKRRYGFDDAFSGVCREAISSSKQETPIYDAILVDEAQDFDPSFLSLCYRMLHAPKRLVYAYDELQSLTDASLPPPEEIFGYDKRGHPRVSFRQIEGKPSPDIILEKCYRNSRPVLTTAHAIGFGIYRAEDPKTGTGLVQMFSQRKLWEEVGYVVEDGELEDGKRVRLARTPQTSPPFLEEHSTANELVQFIRFEDKVSQAEWVANEIEKDLEHEELSHDDIMVINPDPISTRKEVGLPRKILWDKGIDSHLVGVDSIADQFFDRSNESISFTGIFRAKGNEAGMIYILNADNCYRSFGNLSRVRNQLFTAITRSKAWVRVLGIGPEMDALKAEFDKVKEEDFTLDFIYPNEELRKKLKVINRDMSAEERTAAAKSISSLSQLLSDIERGNVLVEDLPDDIVSQLRILLKDN